VPAPNSKQRNKAQAASLTTYKQYATRTNTMGITVRLSQTPIVAAESRHPPGHGRTTPLAREAAILYQVKERHVLENRIRAWVNCGY
jgi:hypothetical protein